MTEHNEAMPFSAADEFATKAYVDNSMAVLGSDLERFEKQAGQLQDFMTSVRVELDTGGSRTLTGANEMVLMTAPQPIEITGVTLVFDNPINVSGASPSCNVRIVRRANSGATAVNIVQKSTTMQGIGGSATTDRRKPWSMTNGSWGTVAARRVPAGESVSLVFGSIVGALKVPLPVLVTIEWRPIR